MLNAIKNFPAQFAYQPKIENKKYYHPAEKYLVLGMGGSHLAADILRSAQAQLTISIHQNYGLPKISDQELKKYLVIASSYSGNTAEVLDGFKKAVNKKLNVVAIATGGRLLALAKKYHRPFIQLPKTGIQPRQALGLSLRAMLKIMRQNKLLNDTRAVQQLKAKNYQSAGQKLAKLLKNHIPIIYSSTDNTSLVYNWKIKFNENSKIPAFYNTLPELNHNEMNGFDTTEKTRPLINKFAFIFLSDDDDSPVIKKRFQVLARLYKKRGLMVNIVKLRGKNIWQKIFANLILADWASYYTALNYHQDPTAVPMVENFKKLL
ncbi:MAG: SIS domain-containing protein [Patescibacteria group bacterium]